MEELGQHETVMRSIRIPIFLDRFIQERTSSLPKVKNQSDAYRYFIATGVRAVKQYEETKNDPTKTQRTLDLLDEIIDTENMVKAIEQLPENVQRALAMAVEFAEMKGGSKKIEV